MPKPGHSPLHGFLIEMAMLAAIFMIAVIPTIVIGMQCYVWLKTGVWHPASLISFGIFPPQTSWLGVAELLWRLFDGYSVAFLSFIAGAGLFVLLTSNLPR